MMIRARWKRLHIGKLKTIGWLLLLAFVFNAGLVSLGFVARAQETVGPPATDGVRPGEQAPETAPDLVVLIEEVQGLADDLNAQRAALAERRQELDDREAALDRQGATLGEGEAGDGGPGAVAPDGDAFRRLVAAFESMEPETSASALIPLYGEHSEAAIDIILSISARQAGAVMDALAGVSPATAASISHDIYVRSTTAKSAGS